MSTQPIEIGKYIIDTLTTGMYDNSLFIFREYVQNAADQIDKAVHQGLIDQQKAEIHITISNSKRSISIHDNATGIAANEVRSLLGNIASSEKDQTSSKGFRGIGRLGGLAYCDLLEYETSFAGEDVKTIMKWDAKKLRSILQDRKIDIGAVALIESVISMESAPCDKGSHFFEVRLVGISDENRELLDANVVREYLSLVAPVSYHSHFYFSHLIHKRITESGYPPLDEYNIYINNDQLFKAYRKHVYQVIGDSKQTIDEIQGLAFEEFTLNSDKTYLAWMWYGIMNYEKQIPQVGNPQRGLRLRCKNIQIGDDSTLVKLFKEGRGNYYFIGEIHAIHPGLVPNARRDYFEENYVLKCLEDQLKKFFAERLHVLYHDANEVKNFVKKTNQVEELKQKLDEKRQNGLSGKVEEKKLVDDIEKAQAEVEKSQKKFDHIKAKAASDEVVGIIFQGITTTHGASTETNSTNVEQSVNAEDKKYLTRDLSKLGRKEQKIVRRIFDVIHNVLSSDTAENLVTKICEELSK